MRRMKQTLLRPESTERKIRRVSLTPVPSPPVGKLARHFDARGLWSLELGLSVPSRHAWSFEARSLSLLHTLDPPSSVLHPTSLDGSPPPLRNAHVVAAAASPDGALIALATSDGRAELHQPPRRYKAHGEAAGTHADSLRLAIRSAAVPGPRFADAAWDVQHDTLAFALSDRPAIWTYDLETCSTDMPTRTHKLSSAGQRGITDLAPLAQSGTLAAAADEGLVYFIDRRERSPVAEFRTPATNNVLAGADPLLYVCGGSGTIRVYDVRKLPARALNSFGSAASKVTDGALSRLRIPPPALAATPVGSDVGAKHFNFAEVVEGGARVVFQLAHGAVGVADLTTSAVELRDEAGPVGATGLPGDGLGLMTRRGETPTNVQQGLFALGAQQAAVDAWPWYVARRRGCVVRGGGGGGSRGWRVVAPCVRTCGVRIVKLGGEGGDRARTGSGDKVRDEGSEVIPDESFRDNQARRNKVVQHSSLEDTIVRWERTRTSEVVIETPGFVTCVTADDELQQFVVGYACNRIGVIT
jgi:hypothetical protein